MSKGRLSAKRFRHVRQDLVAQQRKDPPQQTSPAEVTAKSSRWADVRLVQPVSTTTQQTLLISSVQNVQPDRRPTQVMLRARHRALHARLVGIQPPRPPRVLTVQLDRRRIPKVLKVRHRALHARLVGIQPPRPPRVLTVQLDRRPTQAMLKVRHRVLRVKVVAIVPFLRLLALTVPLDHSQMLATRRVLLRAQHVQLVSSVQCPRPHHAQTVQLDHRQIHKMLTVQHRVLNAKLVDTQPPRRHRAQIVPLDQ